MRHLQQVATGQIRRATAYYVCRASPEVTQPTAVAVASCARRVPSQLLLGHQPVPPARPGPVTGLTAGHRLAGCAHKRFALQVVAKEQCA